MASNVYVPAESIEKVRTGIQGLDEVTGGGLPQGRPTLICGSAGCGKTLLSMEFLVSGATLYDEPGVFIAFEETPEDLAKNVRSLGFNLDDLAAQGKLAVDYIHIDRTEIDEVGEFDLEGLFIRLGMAIDSVNAKRVVLDTIETLFSSFTNAAILRSEIRRLFGWLKDRGVTAVITGERGDGQLTRQGLEEYVSDCVILLDHRVIEQMSTRRLRIVKYRGTSHGTNEYPFLIDEHGISVLPITSLGLQHQVSDERISTGVPDLDDMLGGKGYFRGSSILVSGTAGTGKTSLQSHVVDASCRRGERCLYFAFEESSDQIQRNMRSIGLNLRQWVDAGLLQIHSSRPTLYGLEMHLATMHKHVREFRPSLVVIDPINGFMTSGTHRDAHSMLLRLVDFLKAQNITACFTSLTSGASALEQTDLGLSSIVDTWLLLRDIELGGERNRGLYVLKSRGMAHSNQIREFVLTSDGIELREVYIGQEGVLTGSMRLAQELRERKSAHEAEERTRRLLRRRERKRKAIEAQITLLQSDLEANSLEGDLLQQHELQRLEELESAREEMMRSRHVSPVPTGEEDRYGQ